ncbi:MFS transporter [Levilactobacillus parabrevis]|uniref:Major facilitator superfamily permease n=1 Tax=Levilactobacillus parabrevis ATCC 53295 TaxID=1267003 RepID=A0A0R1GNI0_9LACO|nr:MFS transporter [Levilactobacillus parabrevis]KRK35613.1 major facilitator superfamily permease [Levilactobacillus parabrevis ATCC 53295]KRO05936.1 major facilitator superfamily permease [Levilactobacillus parabrevis]MCT4486381.1 MFS transporter [Levilactobacillus parabrevis]MCT4489039.1 MFS transporter [Levilactobacillus parabrevis]
MKQEIRLRWLLLGALFSSIGMSFIWPLTTIYMHNRLGTSLTEVGIVLLFYSLANVVGSVLGGRLFDRLNPYYLTIGGVTVSLLTLGSLIFNHDWPAFPISLIFLGLASGWTLTMVNSLGTTIHSRDGRYIFNMLYFAQNLGVVLGTAMVGYIYNTSVTLLFGIAASLFVLFLAVAILCYHAPAVMQRQVIKQENQHVHIALPNRRIMAGFFISLVIIWIMYEQWVSNLSVYMTGMGIPMKDYSLLWTLNAGLIVVFQALINWFSHYISNLYMQVYAGIFFVAVSFVTLIFAKDYLHFVIAMVVLTMGEATAFPAIPAIVNNLTPVAVKGKYQGMANAWASVGKAVGPLFGGIVIDHSSYTLLFIIAAVANLAILALNGVIITGNQHRVETFK